TTRKLVSSCDANGRAQPAAASQAPLTSARCRRTTLALPSADGFGADEPPEKNAKKLVHHHCTRASERERERESSEKSCKVVTTHRQSQRRPSACGNTASTC